ncbi:MAG: metallophosphoesterase [Spirochaetia bacterium]|nr:metallophosphoesterase [Spirochaetia bacterium]
MKRTIFGAYPSRLSIPLWTPLLILVAVVVMGACRLGHAEKERYPVKSHPPRPAIPKSNMKVAFVGDQGRSPGTEAVYDLIAREGASLLVALGDFDYADNPELWDAMLSSALGADFPVIAVVGNHDVPEWRGYSQKIKERLKGTKDVICDGEPGVQSACSVNGMLFAVTGVGTYGKGHEPWLDATLQASKAHWKVCVWHKNQKQMQAGDKTDEVGWTAYETCRKYGAFVSTGHEHSYSRTFLLSDFVHQTVVSKSNRLTLEPGKSFAFVSGLGGKSIRPEVKPGPHWASVYTQTQGADYGALFCTFLAPGKEREAECYFKDIQNRVIDRFTIETKL